MNKENQNLLDGDEKKISQFLIWDYIENMHKVGYADVQNNLFQTFQRDTQNYKKYKIITNLLDGFYNNIFSFKSTKRKVLFVGSAMKYPLIFQKAKQDYKATVSVRGKNDRLFAMKNFINYINFLDLSQFVYSFFKKQKFGSLQQLIQKLEDKLRIINPDFVVLWNDSLPIERAIVSVCKKIDIPTIVIQHGIYLTVKEPSDGNAADYVLVWGDLFKKFYIERGKRKPEEIYILGYPFSIEKRKKSREENRPYIVYYIDQNFEKYNKKFLDIKINSIKKISEICKKLDMEFICRLHPGSDRQHISNKLPKIQFAPQNEDLSQSLEKGDIFISFNSTVLVEAAMRSKICIQLMNYPLETDNFENLGVCTKSFKTISEIKKYLTQISQSQNLNQFKTKFNNNYTNLSYNPGKRFLEILNNIVKTRT